MNISQGFTELRLSLADARSALRSAKDTYELVKAESEQRAIDAGCSGKNAEERSRNLTIALARDGAYSRALSQLRQAEAEVDRLDALLESARDARRVDEWTIRARLCDALVGAGVQTDSVDTAGDVVWDDVGDGALMGSAIQVVGQNGTDEFDEESFPF